MIEERVKAVLGAVLRIDPATVGPDTSPESVETWDSLAQMNLVVALEEEFGIEFDDDDLEAMDSFPAVVEAVGRAGGGE